MAACINLREWTASRRRSLYRRRLYRLGLETAQEHADIAFELYEQGAALARDSCAYRLADILKQTWPEEIPADALLVGVRFVLNPNYHEFFFDHPSFEQNREGEECPVHLLV